jgi:aldose 1-epimerase
MISPARRQVVIAAMAATPSGEQFELSSGDQRAVVTEVGAGLRTYSAGGRELLDGYPPEELASSGRGQLLLPWPNRIRDGVYRLDGREHRLPLNEPERGNAIHGLVRWSGWTATEGTDERVVLEHVLHPQPGYPFTLALRVEYSLDADGLAVRTTARNAGAESCPYGAGAHPYLAVDAVDEAVLRLPAQTVLESDERGIPVGSTPVAGAFDFRTPRPVGNVQLDHCFTDLERDEDGSVRVEVDGITVWVDESHAYLMVFTGDALPAAERRRSIAIEPMTCAPNAFASGDGLVVLEPGETHAAAWGITPPAAA